MSNDNDLIRTTPDDSGFAGNSEMAMLMRSRDWSSTPLGPSVKWPQSLKTTLRILLTSRFAMWMGWGTELTFFYNDAYGRETLGVKHPWALGKPSQEVWAEIWSVIGPRIEKVLQTGEATWDEALMLFLERSGYTEETYHTFSYSPLASDQGEITGMLCVVTEETQRVIGERRLALLRDVASELASAKTSAEVFAATVQSIEANSRDLPFTLTYLFDDEGSMARLVSTTGVPEGHAIAAPIIEGTLSTHWPLQKLLKDPQPVAIDHIDEKIADLPTGVWDKPPCQAMVVPIAQQGQSRPAGFLIAAVNPYRELDLEYQGFISLLAGQIASSLSNARAYEAEKKRAEALAELDRAKTIFFSNVSHEFRTPLTLMLGPMEDALAGRERALTGENLEIVHRNGLRLLKLVNTLLDFSRIEAGRVQASYRPTDLPAFTRELASVFRSAIERAGMRFTVNCVPLPEPAYVDRDMWEKIVLNLLSNAFKFTLDGEIVVGLTSEEGNAVLTIRDTGTGIAEDQLPHIFERFHRVEGTRARTHEGTGIGLALVQELVRLHGGTVRVASAYGVGTTFTVSLPLGKAHLPADRVSAETLLSSTALSAETFVEEALRWLPEKDLLNSTAGEMSVGTVQGDAPPVDLTRPRIVLADDNADMREYVRHLLLPHYDVVAVSDGEQALTKAREEKPALVLSDVMMPNLDGFGLLSALRTDPYTASIPVILLSARSGEEARIEGLSAGADDYLIKPFSARELLARVAAHLELARVRRDAEQKIRESEERFRVALSNVPLTVFTCDRERRYTWIANPPQPFPREEIIGKRDEDLYPYHSVIDFISLKERVIATGQGERQEIVFRLDGREEYYDMTVEALRNSDGEIIGLTVAAFDITSIKQYERNLAAANVRLQRAMIETHHRVKNNLQLIASLIDMHRVSGEEMIPTSELGRLEMNVRALGVIHDILTQEAKEGSEQETLSAGVVLDKLTSMLAQTMGERPLDKSFDEVQLIGRQATSLALVANELISNALKHGKGPIYIGLKKSGNSAMLEICDDGPGFPDGFSPRIAANTGLELVENVVEWDLRGMARYESLPEGGARIAITFPILLPKNEWH